MLDLAMEKEHLAKADRDIAEGEKRIARQTALIEHKRTAGIPGLAEAEALLGTLEDTMRIWRSHRATILRTIEEIETGKIGSAPTLVPRQ